MTEYDAVIRGGTVIDGTGRPAFDADVAIAGGRIADVGSDLPPGKEEFDASDRLVTPGFVDIHTHYDGQVTWESKLSPSSEHGVTTVVTGNCGVGFAPCRPEDRLALVELMAGVEDIPEVVMTEGLPWTWETFPQYLDAVASRPHDVDIAAMLPHSALRVYVMGSRAIDREAAAPEDIDQMAALARQAIHAGAIGFGTSRALQQRSSRGEPIPTVRASEEELHGILGALTDAGSGVFQLLSDFGEFEDVAGEFAMIRRLVERSLRPTSFTVNQKHSRPQLWRQILDLTAEATADGLPMKAQVLGRPTGLLLGHDLSLRPFQASATYKSLGDRPLAERVGAMRDPSIRRQILHELALAAPEPWDMRFELEDPPDYEPPLERSFAARARSLGVGVWELAYDTLLEDDGRTLVFQPFQNYAAGSLDDCYEMLKHPDSVLGLGDGGAHLGLICDASYPTTMLAYWTRDRTRGPKLALEKVVKALSADTASAVDLLDRGVLAPGYRADLNVIDYASLQARRPEVVHDLPAGGRRLMQHAEGYDFTFVHGTVTAHGGSPTGELPGRLVRGQQPGPRR